MFPSNKYNNIGEKCKRVNKNIFLNILFHNIINNTDSNLQVKMMQRYFNTKDDYRT